ncbi:Heparan-sulfate 6-O-sulfotransferase 3 [Portunus trituberculatus]|uniref:Heparan-sulfate 6-O-sulfotransferase n=1 Tax=Portunus trituberculatus TaxID=210409 RepID=A0A5B7ISW8_PORTR|nr:Heparan-sulfate 6-O-sulfotransferase 3 [Portunus trituberculatus]
MMTPEDRGRIMLLSAKNNLKKMAFYGLTEEQEISQYLFEVTFNLRYHMINQHPIGPNLSTR